MQEFSFKTYTACVLLACGATCVLTPFVIRFARWRRIIDISDRRTADGSGPITTRRAGKPLLGGVAVFVGLWLPIALLALVDNLITRAIADRWNDFAFVFLASATMLLTGIFDDVRHLSPRSKLAVQILVAVLFATFISSFEEVNVPFLGLSFSLAWATVPVTVLWLVGITNSINLIDGADGLASGVCFLVATTTGILAVLAGPQQAWLALIMFSTAGACLGFLFFNFAPAKIFLGDTGSLMLGMLLATTTVLAAAKSTLATSIVIVIVVLGYPIIDTVLVMVRRSLQGKPVFAGDKGHIHHLLIARGLGHRGAALMIYAICLVLSVLAISLSVRNQVLVIIFLTLAVTGLTVGLVFIGAFRAISPAALRSSRPQFRIAYYLTQLVRTRIQVADTETEALQQFEDAARELGLTGGLVVQLTGRKPANESGRTPEIKDAEPEVERGGAGSVLDGSGPDGSENVIHRWSDVVPADEGPVEGESDGSFPSWRSASARDVFMARSSGYELRARFRAEEIPPDLALNQKYHIRKLFDSLSLRLATRRPDELAALESDELWPVGITDK